MDSGIKRTYDYDRLMHVVIFKPESVRSLIASEPGLINAENYSGETVIDWFVVENDLEKVMLLHQCGAVPSQHSLSEAFSLSLVDMVYLLLQMGVVPDLDSCRLNIRIGQVKRDKKKKLVQAFQRYGYQLNFT